MVARGRVRGRHGPTRGDLGRVAGLPRPRGGRGPAGRADHRGPSTVGGEPATIPRGRVRERRG